MIGYAIQQNHGGAGSIAYTPKWIFFFIPLVLLGMTGAVKNTVRKVNLLVDKLLDFEGRAQRRNAKLPWWDRR
jgi:F0F1-type ATP synthase assembly protein I